MEYRTGKTGPAGDAEAARRLSPYQEPLRLYLKQQLAAAAQTGGYTVRAAAAYSALRLEDALSRPSESFSELLLRRIDERGMTHADAYKKAGVDRKAFNKIKGNRDHRPSKATVILFIFALELEPGEAEELLASAGYALSPSVISDLIIRFFLENGVYDTDLVNEALYEHGQPVLLRVIGTE